MEINTKIMNKVIQKCEEDGKKKPIISQELLNKNKERKMKTKSKIGNSKMKDTIGMKYNKNDWVVFKDIRVNNQEELNYLSNRIDIRNLLKSGDLGKSFIGSERVNVGDYGRILDITKDGKYLVGIHKMSMDKVTPHDYLTTFNRDDDTEPPINPYCLKYYYYRTGVLVDDWNICSDDSKDYSQIEIDRLVGLIEQEEKSLEHLQSTLQKNRISLLNHQEVVGV